MVTHQQSEKLQACHLHPAIMKQLYPAIVILEITGTKALIAIIGLCLLILAIGSGAFSSHSSSSSYSPSNLGAPSATSEVSFGSSGESDAVKKFKREKRDHANYCRRMARWAIEMGDLSSAQSWLNQAAADDRAAE